MLRTKGLLTAHSSSLEANISALWSPGADWWPSELPGSVQEVYNTQCSVMVLRTVELHPGGIQDPAGPRPLTYCISSRWQSIMNPWFLIKGIDYVIFKWFFWWMLSHSDVKLPIACECIQKSNFLKKKKIAPPPPQNHLCDKFYVY